jgi:ubiquinone/menaquinone biosynthesis C-methylase UbiE
VVEILSLEKLKEIFESNIPGYGHRYLIDADFIDNTIKQLDLDKEFKILDIGTGWGVMACMLAINGFNVLTGQPKEWEGPGYCPSSAWRKRAKAIGIEQKIMYQNFNAEDLSFPTDSFDGIFMLITLPYIQKKDVALNECIKICKPKGVIVIIEDNQIGIEFFQNKGMSVGVVSQPLDPRKMINRADVSFKVIHGNYVDVFLLRKNCY